MRRLIGMILVLGLLIIGVPGCELLDRLFPEPPPECPYPGVVCDLLEDIDFDGLGDTIGGIRDCLTGERADE